MAEWIIFAIQVLISLLENALKFTPYMSSIAVLLECAEKESRLTIIDTGIGIPPEDLPHLFERFHCGRNAAEYTGNGLDLAIVKAIVLAHGGTVSVRSQPGHGAGLPQLSRLIHRTGCLKRQSEQRVERINA